MRSPNYSLVILAILGLALCLVGCSTSKEHVFHSFDDTKIAYSDEGTGEPIVLIHGFISNASSWDKTALKKDLLKAGYRVVVPDLRGNGKSERPQHAEAYQDDAEVKDLLALANHLSFTSYAAVGYSRGSIVLAKLLTQDSRISKAVIGGMGVDFTDPNWDRRIAFADAFSGRETPTEMTKGALEYARSINADIKVLGHLQDFQPVTSKEELKQIDTKILVIAGDQDVDNGDPKALSALLPSSELAIIPGDHNNTYKQEDFSEVVIKFLNN